MLFKLKRFGCQFFQNLGCLFFFVFEFIDFRPGRDFINGRGLLIQGGDYMYLFIRIHYLYMWTSKHVDDAAAANHGWCSSGAGHRGVSGWGMCVQDLNGYGETVSSRPAHLQTPQGAAEVERLMVAVRHLHRYGELRPRHCAPRNCYALIAMGVKPGLYSGVTLPSLGTACWSYGTAIWRACWTWEREEMGWPAEPLVEPMAVASKEKTTLEDKVGTRPVMMQAKDDSLLSRVLVYHADDALRRSPAWGQGKDVTRDVHLLARSCTHATHAWGRDWKRFDRRRTAAGTLVGAAFLATLGAPMWLVRRVYRNHRHWAVVL